MAKKNKKTYFPFFLKHNLVRNHDFVQKTLAAGLRKTTDWRSYLLVLAPRYALVFGGCHAGEGLEGDDERRAGPESHASRNRL